VICKMAQGAKRLEIKQLPKTPSSVTPEAKYWQSFKFPVLVAHSSPISCIDFNPASPHLYAVTCSALVEIFDPNTNEVTNTISKLKKACFSARFRSDGKAIVLGTEEGPVKVFDTKTRSVLRQFFGHENATHVARFAPNNRTVMSASDDMTVRSWDLATGNQISVMNGHTDYIRSGFINPATPSVWASGSYDHTIKLWDTSSNTNISTYEHGAPVEDILIYPSGGILVSAGGDNVKIWDLLKGQLVTTLSSHQKTVTCLALDNSRSRLFSASLDHQVKIYSTQTYQVVHSAKYPGPIMSLAFSPASTHLVVGMADGMLSIRHRDRPQTIPAVTKETDALDVLPEDGMKKPKPPSRTSLNKPKPGEHVVVKPKSVKESALDYHLKHYDFRQSIQTALDSKDDQIIVSLINNLLFRKELDQALTGRDDVDLIPILNWVLKTITEPKWGQTPDALFSKILDIYAPVIGQSPQVDAILEKISKRLENEIALQKEMHEAAGVLSLLFSQSNFR